MRIYRFHDGVDCSCKIGVMPAYQELMPRIEARSYRDKKGCRVWTGKKVKGVRGGYYGQINYRGRREYIHRAVWVEEHGKSIPKGWHVHHKCENTLCSEGTHLQAVSPSRHWELTNSRNRDSLIRQECVRGHPMNAANTYVRPNGSRTCRVCNRENLRKKRGSKATRGPYKVKEKQIAAQKKLALNDKKRLRRVRTAAA